MTSILILILFFSFSIFRGCLLFSLIYRIDNAKKWSKISCKVEDSRVTENLFYRMDGKKTRIHFFTFFVLNGVKYGCFNPSLYSGDRKVVLKLIERTKVGSTVDIFYDPNNPVDNVYLSPERHGMLLNIVFFMLSVFLSFSFLIITLME